MKITWQFYQWLRSWVGVVSTVITVENLCVKFSSHHMKIKGCNCWQWPGPTSGKRAFFPLPCSMAGLVAIGHPICIVNMPHVMVIICHSCWLYRIPVFVAIIAFSGWIVNICQEAYVSQCLGTEVLGHVLSMWPNCPTT